ncbi:MAG: hypothetical protein M3P18_17570 [Actinomycetota bacterium]|nr:hypothetical protein [Actinomycetota bacterium]
MVPQLGDEKLDVPHWRRYGDRVAAALRSVGNPVVFVAHSGAGPLLPSHFATVYDLPAAQARARGWPCERVEGGHLHMLADPAAVASAVLRLAA